MKTKNCFLPSLFLSLIIMACGGGISSIEQAAQNLIDTKVKVLPGARPPSWKANDLAERDPAKQTGLRENSRQDAAAGEINITSLLRSLDEMADLERSGSWIKGMAFAESGLRENAGDLAGAVAAAFKELSWAYGLGLIQKNEIENGLLNVLNEKENETISYSANAMIDFLNEKWNEAVSVLSLHFNNFDEPDCFGRWMILVCILEKNKAASSDASYMEEFRRTAAAYKSIRARYAPFPEYWYRGARVFSGAVGADYAENCINISPQGPFAGECRKILASFTGLKKEDSLSIKTKREIDAVISAAVNSGNPQILDSLLPLINLPDNPFTVYAVSALRSLSGIPKFRDYFSGQAASSSGRLSERLIYICRS